MEPCDIEKDLEGSRINDIMQYSNNIVTLWQTLGQNRVVCTQTTIYGI